jgi:hypothetical protein
MNSGTGRRMAPNRILQGCGVSESDPVAARIGTDMIVENLLPTPQGVWIQQPARGKYFNLLFLAAWLVHAGARGGQPATADRHRSVTRRKPPVPGPDARTQDNAHARTTGLATPTRPGHAPATIIRPGLQLLTRDSRKQAHRAHAKSSDTADLPLCQYVVPKILATHACRRTISSIQIGAKGEVQPLETG